MKGSLGARFMKLFNENLNAISRTEIIKREDGIILTAVIGGKYFTTLKPRALFAQAANELADIVINYYFINTDEFYELVNNSNRKK